MGQANGRLLLSGLVAAAALAATAAISIAPAAPLDKETCEQLKREAVEFEKLGTRDHLTKGAAWGKANLKSAQLDQVKKLIEIDEAIAFRCPRLRPATEAKAGKAGGAVALVKPKPKPRPKPVAQGETGAAPSAAPASAAAAAPKPKPRPAAKPAEAPKAPPAQ